MLSLQNRRRCGKAAPMSMSSNGILVFLGGICEVLSGGFNWRRVRGALFGYPAQAFKRKCLCWLLLLCKQCCTKATSALQRDLLTLCFCPRYNASFCYHSLPLKDAIDMTLNMGIKLFAHRHALGPGLGEMRFPGCLSKPHNMDFSFFIKL